MKPKLLKTKEGVKVIFERCTDVKGIVFELHFNAGALNDPIGKCGLAHFCEHAIMGFATKKHSRVERSNNHGKFQQFNAYTADYDTCYYVMTTKNKIDEAVDTLTEPFSDIIYSQNNFDSEFKIISDEIATQLKTNNMQRVHLLRNKVYKSKEFKNLGYTYAGSQESLNRIKLKDVQAFIEKFYNIVNLTVNVVGNITESEIKKLISKYVATRLNKIGEKGFSIKNNLGYKEPAFYYEKACEKDKALFYVHYKLLDFRTEKYYNRDWYIENRIVSYVLSLVIFDYFRTKKELCYSCSCNIFQKADGVYLSFNIVCQEENINEVVKEYPEFIKSLFENFTEEKLNQAKEVFIGALNFDYNDLASKANINFRQYDIYGYLLDDKKTKKDEEFIKKFTYQRAITILKGLINKKPNLIILANNEKYKDFDYKDFCKNTIIKK